MRLILVLFVSIAATPPLAAQSSLEGRVDSVFRQYASTESPGCVIGVAQHGRVLLERAYGMADLERGVALTPASILEAGSVSKQFTAAAVLLLARDGKLTLDDPVRRWVPELPEVMQPITLRHMLHHTSGLRDWGSIAGVGGWPRNTRALDHTGVLQIIARMRELNFPPGTEYEYSNSNYNLLAIVAERASGEPFPAFTRRRIFEPLGMTSTSWRDDAMRVVRRRALSYDKDSSGWLGERAIEDIYGNCCLLTTVGDLLKWNAAFDSTRLGGAGFRAEQERRGVLANGQTITYAAGLFVDTYRGQPYVAHSGATAGYRANTVRYPQAGVSVAVLCNAGNADPEIVGRLRGGNAADVRAAHDPGGAGPSRGAGERPGGQGGSVSQPARHAGAASARARRQARDGEWRRAGAGRSRGADIPDGARPAPRVQAPRGRSLRCTDCVGGERHRVHRVGGGRRHLPRGARRLRRRVREPRS